MTDPSNCGWGLKMANFINPVKKYTLMLVDQYKTVYLLQHYHISFVLYRMCCYCVYARGLGWWLGQIVVEGEK